MKLSIIIVAYKNQEVLKKCLESIPDDKNIEVVVVDNSENNRGFAKACNEGFAKSKGNFVLFLNPDTEVNEKALKLMMQKLEQNMSIKMVGPKMVDSAGKEFSSSTQKITKLNALIVFSIFNKLTKFLGIKFWNDKNNLVANISGAAMMMRRNDFEEIGGFDEKFFMYWEDNDLCRRIQLSGGKIWYAAEAVIRHDKGGVSKKSELDLLKIFEQSRYYFFKKHFGLVYALFLEGWIKFWSESKLLLILSLATFFRVDRLFSLVALIGDQGRDLLAALEMANTGVWPLLGINSSIPRFSQGPVFVWLMALVFKLFSPSFENVAIMSLLISLTAIGFTYFLVTKYLNKQIALVVAFLMAISPFAIHHSRFVFMTNPIPLATGIFIYFLVKKKRRALDYLWMVSSFGLLFQFELAHAPLILLIIKELFDTRKSKIKFKYLMSILGLLLGFLPQIIYDLTHYFSQLGVFLVWIGYRIISFFGFDPEHVVSMGKVSNYGASLLTYLPQFFGISLVVFLIYVFINIKQATKNKLLLTSGMIIIIQILAYFVHGTPSEAYYLIFIVPLAIWGGFIFYKMQWYVKGLVFLLLLTNLINFYNSEYLTGAPRLSEQKKIVNLVKFKTNNYPVNWVGLGEGSEFTSFMDGYKFLYILSGGKLDPEGLKVYVYPKNSKINFLNAYEYQFQNMGVAIERP